MTMQKKWRRYDGYNWEDFGLWIRNLRTALGWTLEQLGRKIGVGNKGTMSRIEKGRQGLSSEQRQQLVNLLAEETQKHPSLSSRREFIKATGLKLAGIGLIQTITPAELSLITAPMVSTRERGEHEALVEHIYDLGVGLTETWDACLFQGQAKLVYQQALHRYQFFTASPYLGDSDCALTAMRIGIRLARAQDVLLDWFKRKDTVIERYNDIEERIIRRFADRLKRKREIIHEYAQLLALRGSLKREIGMYRGSSLDLNKSIELAQKLGDHLLQVDVICELAHLWLAIGKQEQWQETLERAREVARSAPIEKREGLFALVTYYVGAGQRRLAFDAEFTLAEKDKIQVANSAIEHMQISRQKLGDEWTRYVLQGSLAGHPLITRVSEVQCRIWTEPESMEQELEQLKPLVASEFPGLTEKIVLTEPWSQVRRQWSAHNGIPFFDLSGKRDFEGRPKRFPK